MYRDYLTRIFNTSHFFEFESKQTQKLLFKNAFNFASALTLTKTEKNIVTQILIFQESGGNEEESFQNKNRRKKNQNLPIKANRNSRKSVR